MGSSPTFKNLDALIEQPESGSSPHHGIIAKIYAAKYSVCLANQKTVGTIGTGDLTGYQIKTSAVSSQRGEWAKLTDTWEIGGAGADPDPETNPVPPDTFNLTSQELNPSVEKNVGFHNAVTDETRYNRSGLTNDTTADFKTLLSWARKAGLETGEESDEAYRVLINFVLTLGGAAKFDEALVLAQLLRRGVQNFYKATFFYSWRSYHYFEPTLSVGGVIETPGGPLASAIADLELVCLRQADDLEFDGRFYALTNKWICALDDNETFWEPVLYLPP